MLSGLFVDIQFSGGCHTLRTNIVTCEVIEPNAEFAGPVDGRSIR